MITANINRSLIEQKTRIINLNTLEIKTKKNEKIKAEKNVEIENAHSDQGKASLCGVSCHCKSSEIEVFYFNTLVYFLYSLYIQNN